MRKSAYHRRTEETEIEMELTIDGTGRVSINTGVPFFDHVLRAFAVYGLFDLTIKASGDLETGDHHTVEDVGICLGETLKDALDDRENICRFGWAIIPMDDSLSICSIDVGGRGYTVFDGEFEMDEIGGMSTQNVDHFIRSFAAHADININVKLEGGNDHHKIEATFKSLGIALDNATRIEARRKK
jgi:imidazoleglycerol-phosphate dehydratase